MVRESCPGKRSRLVLTLGLALAGVALLGAGLGCGVASTTATQAAASTTTPSSPATTVSATQPTLATLDRRDPESVLRAYFSAWQNGDWDGEASFMAEMYAHMEPEPVKSLHIVDLRRVEGSSSQCLYAVTFDFVPKGDVISMEAGRYDWTYDLSWDEARQSWIIINYGEG